jgi:hypothetical protein
MVAKMKINDIKVGGFYVSDKKGFVREVVEVTESGDVLWRDFLLSSGEPIGGPNMCSKYTLSQWANREATSEEIARFQRKKADLKENVRTAEIAEMVLANVPDEQLLAEVRRRGLNSDG